MSEHDEVPPPPSDAARAFLAEHAQTGEPSPADLARLKLRLAAPPAPAPRRTLLRSEWMAAAAVLVVVVGLQGAWWLYRSQQEPSEAERQQLDAITEAYRAGDLDGAEHLASASCNAAACGSLKTSLDKVKSLSRRLESLSPEEFDELRTLDAQLSNGVGSPLTRKLVRKTPAPTSPEQAKAAEAAYAEVAPLIEAHRYQDALRALEHCLALDPNFSPCVINAAEVHAVLADEDPSHVAPAADLYARYLQLETSPLAHGREEATTWLTKNAPGKAIPPQPPEPTTALEWYVEASRLHKAHRLELALLALDKCLRLDPNFAACLRLQGSVYASIAARDGTTFDMERARAAYQRFLEVAPADDPTRAMVQQILEKPDAPSKQDHAELPSTRSNLKPTTALEKDGFLSLAPGETTDVLSEVAIARVAIGDPAVADITVVEPKTLRVKGVATGKTTLLIWWSTGKRDAYLIDVK